MTTTRTPETLEQRAKRWMLENTEAMRLFQRFAEEKRAAGLRFGIGELTERVRWECSFRYGDSLKVNNNYRAYIARWLIHHDPRLADLIKCRKTPAANKPARDVVLSTEVDPITEEAC